MNLLSKISSLFESKRSMALTDNSFFRFFSSSNRNRIYNGQKLEDLYRRNELAYACISKIADVMNDAKLVVEKVNNKGEWEEVKGHPLTALMLKPNPEEVGLDLRKKIVQSENFDGKAYIRLIRPRPMAPPVEIYVLNPNRVYPELNYSLNRIEYYRYSNLVGQQIYIAPEDMLIRRRADLTDEFGGLAPMAVAANTIDSDENMTDYINAFFDPKDGNAGIPAGILKFTSTLSPELAEMKRKMWNKNTSAKDVQVLDQNAEFIPVASKISELGSDTLRAQNEAKVLQVFQVPAILVSAYLGYLHTTQNATAKSALKDFYLNKISPELKSFREWLTWFVLPLFEPIDQIKAEKIRVSWDLSQMLALQEDLDAMHKRERDDFAAGGITLNEYRAAIGKAADPKGDYYLQPFNLNAISPENRAQIALRQVAQGTDPNEAPKEEPKPEPDEEAKKVKDYLTEKKTFDFDGLTLSREPNEIEKLIDLKSLVSDLEAQSNNLETNLLKYRDALINQALSAAKDLDEKTIFTLTLERNEKLAKFVNKSLNASYEIGRKQVLREINAQSSAKNGRSDYEFKDLLEDELKEKLESVSDSVLAKLINEIQSRAINIYTALKLLNFDVSGFFDEMKKRLLGESTAFVSQTSRNAANLAIQSGRKDEISEQSENWSRVQYSALLDSNCCEFCEAEDGTESTNEDDLASVPNSDCLGGSNCRCFHVVILDQA